MHLITVEQMQAIERAANAGGLSYAQMMENAGNALANTIQILYGWFKGSALGLVGSGNNGGDTLIALTVLAQEHEWQVAAYLAAPRPADDPLLARLRAAGGAVISADEDPNGETLAVWAGEYAIWLDGILGTGIRLPLRPELANLLARLQDLRREYEPVLYAVDCPSGVNCNTGEAAPQTLRATHTVCMAAAKVGLFTPQARPLCGEIEVVKIGLPADLAEWQAVKTFVPDENWVAAHLPPRPHDADKRTFGAALIVAGSLNYSGAALLSGRAAFRVGAGWVTLAVPAPLHAALAGHFPEATWLLLPHEMGIVNAAAAKVVHENLKRPTAMLIGPGLGVDDGAREFLRALLEGNPQDAARPMGFARTPQAPASSSPGGALPPLIVDADGLKLLAQLSDWWVRLPKESILTPHVGEMAILSGLSGAAIQAQRLALAQRYAAEWGQVLVLKGAFTVIAAPDGRAAVLDVATAALARAGTGDILAGLMVGLRAQGVAAFECAVMACWLHAQAGLQAEQRLGAASVLAGDVLKRMPQVLKAIGRV